MSKLVGDHVDIQFESYDLEPDIITEGSILSYTDLQENIFNNQEQCLIPDPLGLRNYWPEDAVILKSELGEYGDTDRELVEYSDKAHDVQPTSTSLLKQESDGQGCNNNACQGSCLHCTYLETVREQGAELGQEIVCNTLPINMYGRPRSVVDTSGCTGHVTSNKLAGTTSVQSSCKQHKAVAPFLTDLLNQRANMAPKELVSAAAEIVEVKKSAHKKSGSIQQESVVKSLAKQVKARRGQKRLKDLRSIALPVVSQLSSARDGMQVVQSSSASLPTASDTAAQSQKLNRKRRDSKLQRTDGQPGNFLAPTELSIISQTSSTLTSVTHLSKQWELDISSKHRGVSGESSNTGALSASRNTLTFYTSQLVPGAVATSVHSNLALPHTISTSQSHQSQSEPVHIVTRNAPWQEQILLGHQIVVSCESEVRILLDQCNKAQSQILKKMNCDVPELLHNTIDPHLLLFEDAQKQQSSQDQLKLSLPLVTSSATASHTNLRRSLSLLYTLVCSQYLLLQSDPTKCFSEARPSLPSQTFEQHDTLCLRNLWQLSALQSLPPSSRLAFYQNERQIRQHAFFFRLLGRIRHSIKQGLQVAQTDQLDTPSTTSNSEFNAKLYQLISSISTCLWQCNRDNDRVTGIVWHSTLLNVNELTKLMKLFRNTLLLLLLIRYRMCVRMAEVRAGHDRPAVQQVHQPVSARQEQVLQQSLLPKAVPSHQTKSVSPQKIKQNAPGVKDQTVDVVDNIQKRIGAALVEIQLPAD